MANPDPYRPQRFSKENQPKNRGRKKGGIVKSRVTRMRDEMLEDFLGKAHKNVKEALNKGDLKVSMWLIDHVRRKREDEMDPASLAPLIKALDSFEEIEQASQDAVLLAIRGDMTFKQLRATQDALARHSVLKGLVEIGSLREEVKALQNIGAQRMDLSEDHLPAWGRLRKPDVVDAKVEQPEDQADG